ncbi:hypothetical protein ACFP1I_04410 [Dyadobacter subterraneus]|uniref:DUF3108 domain-containing protein n=1 Tax=Dyadobacter subterraneus TaxID=2773304 RepID=A0ABR9WIC2_9BACT|nr:hypothetical protein [Dyadobacter subterraneus]MBE9464626.1 hypothetical protein [Dyadobacter subterraneus]
MKNRILLVIVFSFFAITATYAQECFGVKMKAGSGFDMATYDGKGKLTGNISYKIAKVSQEGGMALITLDMEVFDPKGKSQLKNSYQMKCNGSTLMIDASTLINQEQMKSFENFNMKFTSTNIEYPTKLTVGEKLKDASLKGEGTSGPMAMTMNMLISNRNVEDQEKVTIPAGTFDAYKLTSDMKMETKMGFGITVDINTISWRAPGVLWDIKSESYRKGKLISRSELTKIY